MEEIEQLKRKLKAEKHSESFAFLLDCCVTTDQVIFLIRSNFVFLINYHYVMLPFPV